MLVALLGIAAVIALVAASAGKTAGGDAERALIPGRRYKITFRASDTRRQGAPFAALESLTSRLASLGWTSTFLEPVESEPDPYQWNAEAIWSGARTTLLDGQNIFFLGAQDVSQRADHHGAYDADLPPAEEEAVNRALQFETDPQALNDFAASLRPQFPIAAGALEARATQLQRNPNAPPAPSPSPSPSAPSLPSLPSFPIQPTVPFFPNVVPPPPAPPSFPSAPSSSNAFDPGALPKLPTIPQAGKADTTQHRKGQRGLVAFFASNPVRDPEHPGDTIHYLGSEVDGIIGPHTQKATWAFQRWANRQRGAKLTEDGLFGTNTYAALAEFGT